jgi:hypothetical protein
VKPAQVVTHVIEPILKAGDVGFGIGDPLLDGPISSLIPDPSPRRQRQSGES